MELSATNYGRLTSYLLLSHVCLTIANPFHTQYTDSTQVIPSGSTDES
jgi:hypothetical protein